MARNRPIIFTVMNSAALFILGLVNSQKGPSFNDLMLISNTDVAGGSFYLTASNFGSLLGSLLAGVLYERTKTKTLTIAVAMMMVGVFTALTPWCFVFAAMLVAHGLVSTFSTLFETTVNTEEIQAWNGNSQSAMQFLSFSYSLGGVFGPLITEPFMAPKETSIDSNNISSSNASTNITPLLGETFSVPGDSSVQTTVPIHVICSQLISNCTDYVEDNFTFNISTGKPFLNNSFTKYDTDSHIHYAYLITGAMSVAVSMAFCAASLKTRSKRYTQERPKEKTSKITRKLPKKVFITLMGMVCAFFYFHQMGIDVFGQYRFYFVVTHLDWSKQNGAYLMSMYWVIAMCVKLALVVIYKRVETGVVLCFSVSGIVTSMILFCIAGYYHIHMLVWISTASMAVSQSSMFSGSLSWTDGNLIKLDGKETSALMISASLGALSGPIPVAALMKDWTFMAYPYFVMCQFSISASLFVIMIFVVKPFINRRYGSLRPPAPSSSSKGDAHELMVQNKFMIEYPNGQSEEFGAK